MLGKRLINTGGGATPAPSCTTDTLQILGDTSCKAYYKMSDATDESGNFDGTPTNVNFNVQGKFGNAGYFPSGNSEVQTTLTTNYSNVTLSAWVKYSTLPNGGADGTIIQKGFYTSGSNTQYLHLRYESYNNIGFTFAVRNNSAYNSQAIASVTATIGIWYHIVGILDSSGNAQIYVNGGAGTGITGAPSMTNSNPIRIGGQDATQSNKGDVAIDQIRIFNKSLTSSEVTTLYNEVYCVPTIVPTANFNPVIYTGTGNSRSLTGVGFKPDFIWMKRRNTAQEHALVDAVRGVQKELNSDTTAAEGTSTNGVSSFDSDGFTVGSNGLMNNTNDTYVAWNWYAPTAETNTNGSEDSTIKKNVDAGFSIVKSTTTGNNYTVGHGLSQRPQIVFNKNLNRSDASYGQWWTWIEGVTGTNGDYIRLNGTATKFNTSDTFTTDTTIKYSTGFQAPSSSESIISYAFHSVDGMSRVGSYVGTGAAGNSINLGFRPAFVMIKITTASNSWFIYDNKRDTTNPNSAVLLAEDSYLEQTDTFRGINFNSNGFEAGNSVNYNYSGTNQSSQTYIFLAFAEEVFTPITRNATNPFGDASELALYKFEDNANDAEGNHDGVFTNPSYVTGYIDKAASFNGSTSKILTSSKPLGNKTSLSISFWAKNISVSDYSTLMGEGVDSGTPGYRILIKNSNDGNLSFSRADTSGYIISDGNFFDFDVNGSEWVHVVFTVSPTQMKYYKDGVNVSTSTISNSSTVNSTYDFHMMTDPKYNRQVGGQLDQVRVFNRVLDDGEVMALYLE